MAKIFSFEAAAISALKSFTALYRITVSLLLLFISPSINAAPVYYTLDGMVTGVYGVGSSVENLNFQFGTEISYRFFIDIDRAGFTLMEDGSRYYHPNIATENDQVTYFYAELLEISYEVTDSYFGLGRVNYYANNTDSTAFSSPIARTGVGLGNLIWDTSSFIDDWEAGDNFGGSHSWHDSTTGEYITVVTSMTLTSISSVPLPTTVWLFGTALFGLVIVKRNA